MGASVVAQTSLWSRYTAKAELVGAAVMRTATAEGAATLLAEAAEPGYVCTASVASHFPEVAAGALSAPAGAAEHVERAAAADAAERAEHGAALANVAGTRTSAAEDAEQAAPPTGAAGAPASAIERGDGAAAADGDGVAAEEGHGVVAKEGDDVAAEVVTVAPFAIAETGSVALDEPRADRGRCFLAERLWVLVPEEAIVATLDDGLARLQALVAGGAHHPLLMTGPSRTADIERTLTVGVHGPRALVIVVVGQA